MNSFDFSGEVDLNLVQMARLLPDVLERLFDGHLHAIG